MPPKKVYTPDQVAVGTFFGGPLAATYFIYKNYMQLGEENKALKTIIYGVLILAVLFCGLLVIPDNYKPSRRILSIIISATATAIVISEQMTREQIKNSDDYVFASNWKTLGVTLLSAAITFILFLFMLRILGLFLGI